MREPIFGPNARPFFVQYTVALCALFFFTALFNWIGAYDFFYRLSCNYVTGSCLEVQAPAEPR